MKNYLRIKPFVSRFHATRQHYNEFKPLPTDLQAIKDALIARPKPQADK
jgi:hypothetical protein